MYTRRAASLAAEQIHTQSQSTNAIILSEKFYVYIKKQSYLKRGVRAGDINVRRRAKSVFFKLIFSQRTA